MLQSAIYQIQTSGLVMASPFAADHPPAPQAAFSSAACLDFENSMPPVASVPAGLSTSRTPATRATRSRTAATRAASRNRAPAAASTPSAARGSQRKRRAAAAAENGIPSSNPRKRVRTVPPKSSLSTGNNDERKPAATESCCICMCDVDVDDLAGISGCEHKFCFGCIEKWSERENSCPLCKVRFTKIDRVSKKRKKGQKNTKSVKSRDQRSDFGPGVALEGLLATLSQRSNGAPNIARLIFSGSSFGFGGERRRTFFDDHPIGSLPEEDEEEDESPLSNFIRAFHTVNIPASGFRPVSVSAHVPAGRSYASNSNDRSAGNRAENPLEIDDDSDDEVVEVVHLENPQR